MNFEQACIAALKDKGISAMETLTDRGLRIINKIARASDQPHLYPYIPAADKAIRYYSRVYFRANGPCLAIEYILGLESLMSDYVNERKRR